MGQPKTYTPRRSADGHGEETEVTSKYWQRFLLLSVFVSGGCVLAVEIVATRILAPYFGNTIFTVSSVISVTLAALSIGYYVGGRYADKHPSIGHFFAVTAAGGASLLLLHVVGTVSLPLLGARLSVTAGPLIASLLLFFVPAVFLGALSPLAVTLRARGLRHQGVGRAAGEVLFWSTSGSIAGSLSSAFVLIPRIGIDQIIVGCGVTLTLLGLGGALWFRRAAVSRHSPTIAALALLTAGTLAIGPRSNDSVYAKDGIYSRITIEDGLYNNRPTRFFRQDRSLSGAMFLDTGSPTDLTYEYTKYYVIAHALTAEIRHALVIGGGAYSIPKALLAEFPSAIVHVAEIEPSLFALATKYFRTTRDPRLRIVEEDGRRYLTNSSKKFDMVFGDAFYTLYSVPSHLTTAEFFEAVKIRLTAKGLFIVNLIGNLSHDGPSFTWSEIRTFRSVFPNSLVLALRSPTASGIQSIILVGCNGDEAINVDDAGFTESTNPILQSIASKVVDVRAVDLTRYPLLTDRYAPVEHLTAIELRRLSSRPR